MTRGRIFDLKRFAIHDGPGIRSTVFMSGCPLSCWWCHNPEGIDAKDTEACLERKGRRTFLAGGVDFIGEEVAAPALLKALERDRIFYEETGGGVTFSGGEPLMQPGFLLEAAGLCRKAGLHVALDTSGYAPRESLEMVMPGVDLFLYDLKIADDRDHERYTGVSNGIILDNLKVLSDTGASIWARIPLIPGITDTDANTGSLARLLARYDRIQKVCLLPYNMIGEDKFRRLGMEYLPGPLKTQDDETIEAVSGRFARAGFEVSVGG